jgi:hypothetical protein
MTQENGDECVSVWREMVGICMKAVAPVLEIFSLIRKNKKSDTPATYTTM